jgi:anti-sigma regulatory factor (Ser/Thr protein kinase)
MEDLSLHILDIAQNSVDGGARHIEISIEEDSRENLLTIVIADDGTGMDEMMIKELTDPFFTTKGKKVGLGIPLLAQSAREADGNVTVRSEQGSGTTIKATFRLDHVDRRPVGDLTSTLLAIISGNPHIDVLFDYRIDSAEYSFDSMEVRKQLGDVPINYIGAISLLRKTLSDGMESLRKGGSDEQRKGTGNR